MGRRPNHQPTEEDRKIVGILAMAGWTNEEIAKHQSVSANTIKRHYKNELTGGRRVANAKVVAALYKNATKHNNVAAQIFWLKARMGWAEGALAGESNEFKIDVRVTSKGERLKAEDFDEKE